MNLSDNTELVERLRDKNSRLDDLDSRLVEKINSPTSTQANGNSTAEIYSMSAVLHESDIQKKLSKSNILIFGVVGFFDPICRALSKFYYEQYKRRVELKKTYTTTKFSKQDNVNKQTPLLILPTAENHQLFNKIVANVLHLERPAWVVALPSQLDSHLFSSFNCFFISSRPIRELRFISNVTPVTKDDILKLRREKIQAILSTDTITSTLGVPNRMGSVIYINGLDN